MKLVDSLLDAISRLEGDALIMHVGEKPYVVTTSASMYAYRGPLAWGHVELSSRVLTTEAVAGMLEQLVPAEHRKSLDEYGAIEYELPHTGPSADRFTVVAARGGDDVWLEVRRTPAALGTVESPPAAVAPEPVEEPIAHEHVAPEPEHVAPEPEHVAPEHVAPSHVAPADVEDIPAFEIVEDEPQIVPTHAEVDALLSVTAAALLAAGPEPRAIEQPVAEQDPVAATADETPVAEEPVVPELVAAESFAAQAVATPVEQVQAAEPQPVAVSEPAPEPEPEPALASEPELAPEPAAVVEPIAAARPVPTPEPLPAPEPVPAPQPVMASAPEGVPEGRPVPPEEPRQAVVLPLSRSPIGVDAPPEIRTAAGTPLERILRIAAARGAATVYVVAQAKPVIRVDGEISVLEGEPVLTAVEVERLVMDLAPARARDAAPAGEWMAEVPDVGRVRCLTFRDHRGPGVIFRMIPPKAISADQLGIPPEVQALCAQPDGLVLVTGARASGKSTLLSAFVDLINRTRSDHVITIEPQIGFVHESRRSFVSQREVRGDSETVAGAVRSAFREDPDVLVIEDMRTPEIVSAALEAAESGRLVFGSVSAPSTVAAVDRLIEMYPLDRRAQAQTSLAGALRGVVAQSLLRKVRGGRIAAREILLNTPAVAALILEGKTFQLPVALDSGRRHGMLPLVDSLAALVREGTVHAAEAYRKATDRDALLGALRRDGVDTSFAERLA